MFTLQSLSCSLYTSFGVHITTLYVFTLHFFWCSHYNSISVHITLLYFGVHITNLFVFTLHCFLVFIHCCLCSHCIPFGIHMTLIFELTPHASCWCSIYSAHCAHSTLVLMFNLFSSLCPHNAAFDVQFILPFVSTQRCF